MKNLGKLAEPMCRLWVAVQVGKVIVGVWPFSLNVRVDLQPYRVVMLGVGLSEREEMDFPVAG